MLTKNKGCLLQPSCSNVAMWLTLVNGKGKYIKTVSWNSSKKQLATPFAFLPFFPCYLDGRAGTRKEPASLRTAWNRTTNLVLWSVDFRLFYKRKTAFYLLSCWNHLSLWVSVAAVPNPCWYTWEMFLRECYHLYQILVLDSFLMLINKRKWKPSQKKCSVGHYWI